LLSPIPTQHNVENQVKLQVLVSNFVWGLGGEVSRVKLYSRWRVCKSAKSVNLSQDFCP